LELGAEPGDEITNGAVGEPEPASDRGHGLAFHEEGPGDLVMALLGLLGIEEELPNAMVVHDRPSQLSLNYFEKPGGNGILDFQGVTRAKGGMPAWPQ
jgi:hypothetical protein